MSQTVDLNVKICPTCSHECPPLASRCVCGHAFPDTSTRVTPAVQCAKCAAPLSPGFLMCPICGQAVYPTRPSVMMLVSLWGAVALCLTFGFVSIRATNFDSRHLLAALAEIAYVAALVLAIILVNKRNMTDRLNGWIVIGLVSTAFVITTIDPALWTGK